MIVFLVLFFSTLTVDAQTCNVTDYLYLNDVTKDNNGNGIGFVHKMRLNANVTATEIHSTGTKPWFPSGGVLKTPHGLGQDLNGNLYIGQTGDGPIAKIKCDGTLVKANFINDGGFNIISKDGYLYVNSNDGERINRYALCDGSAQGYITLGGDYTYGTATLKDWGLDIDANGTFYVSAGFNFTDRDKNTYLYRFKPTNADFTNHTTYTANKSTGVGGTLKSGTGINGISDRNEVWGITHDPSGNMYLVVRDWEDPSDTETWILKFDKNFNLIDSMVERTSSATGGIEGARGIVYYAPWDRLLIAGGPDGDCIAKVRPSDMTYVGALAPNEPDQTPKTLRIASEACPVSASLTIDTTLCNVQAGDKVFLQNIVGKCNAPICGGIWTANSGNAGITFNECDLSFTVTNVAIGCGTFVLTNVGGTCGDFTITVNVDFANVTAPVIAGDQTVCADSENPAAFTVTTPATGSNTIKYQWQKSTVSCTEGFSNIAGANATVYNPGIVSQTTYYRVITTVDGSCATPHGSCTDTSNCVTVTTKVCCTQPDAGPDAPAVCQPIATAKLTAVTAGGTWIPIDSPANPSAATIDANGNITGMTAAGTYKFVYSVTGGGFTCTDTAQVVVNAKPSITDGAATICAGETVDLTSKITDYDTFLSPVWTLTAAGGTTVATPKAVQPTTTTTYVLVAQNANSCQDTANVVITVNPKPDAGADQTLACADAQTNTLTTSTTLVPSPAGGTWAQIGATPAVAAISGNVVSGMTTPGTYQFVYTLKGCKDTVAVTVETCAGCVKPNAGSDVTLTCPPTGIAPTTATLTPVTTGGTWAAQAGNPAIAAVTGNSVTGLTAAGTYRFIYSVTGGGQTCTDTVQIIVPVCTLPCVKSNVTLTGSPVCSADVQTYSLTFSVSNKLGSIKVNKGTLTGNNPYTVAGIPSGASLTITDSLSAVCKSDTVITGPNCNCTPPLPILVTPSQTVCLGDTFPTLKATVVGLATVEWFATSTSTTVLFTGLNYKPAGTVTAAGAVFYAQARSTDPSCPAAVSTSRVMATINAQDCNQEVDLALKKSINKKIAQLGDELTYTLKVWNESNTNATGMEVVDSIATTVQFVAGSFSTSRGSASITGNVIKWVIGNMAANGDTVTLTYKVKATQEGVHFNTAEISKTNEKDVDSTPGNGKEGEDDIDRQCFTVPVKLCPGEKAEVSVPVRYTNVQWFKEGSSTPVGTGNSLLLSEVGTYTFTATNQSCPASGCCPVIIEPGVNCCPEELCIPFTIKQTKKRKK